MYCGDHPQSLQLMTVTVNVLSTVIIGMLHEALYNPKGIKVCIKDCRLIWLDPLYPGDFISNCMFLVLIRS